MPKTACITGILWMAFLCLSSNLPAQRAIDLLYKGIAQTEDQRYSEAIATLKQALPGIPPHDAYHQALCRVWLGEAYFYLDQYVIGLEFTLEAEKIAESGLHLDTLSYYPFLLNNKGALYAALLQPQKQYAAYRKAFVEVKRRNPSPNEAWANAYFNLGNVYYRLMQPDSCLIYWDSALVISHKLNDEATEAALLLNLAVVQAESGDYVQAIATQKKAYALTRMAREQYTALLNLSDYYFHLNDLQSAQSYTEQLLRRVMREDPEFVKNSDLGVMIYGQLGHLQLIKEDTLGFAQTVNALLSITQNSAPEYHWRRKIALNYLAYQYQRRRQWRALEEVAQQALSLSPGKFLSHDASTYRVLADACFQQYNYEDAAVHLQKSLRLNCPDYAPSSPFDLPKPGQIVNLERVLELLALRLRIFTEWGLACQDKTVFDAAEATHQLIEELFFARRRQMHNPLSRQLLGQHIRRMTQAALRLYYLRHRLSGQPQWLDKAWRLMENSRALLLVEDLNLRQGFNQLPPALGSRLRQLSIDISLAQSTLDNTPDLSPKEKAQQEKHLLALEDEWNQLLNNAAQTQGAFFNWIYASPNSDIKDVVRELQANNELLLSFYEAGKVVYLMALGAERPAFYAIDLNGRQATEWVSELRELLLRRSGRYYHESSRFYQQLIQPALRDNPQKNLVIIPDGALWLAPFDGLVTGQYQAEAPHSELSFLGEERSIRYWFSFHAHQTQQKQNNKARPFKLLAVSPMTRPLKIPGSLAGEQLPPLSGAGRTLKHLQNLFGEDGRYLSGYQATAAALQQAAGQATILHIDSHALLNDKAPQYSKLVFHPNNHNPADSNFVYAWQIRQMNLPVELAVLGFCDSGNGKINPGEGLFSLSRDFALAGCKNMVVSTWPLSDEPAAYITDKFYDYLLKGYGKADALLQAKKDYLAEDAHRLSRHPYYWAGLSLLGDNTPMRLDKPGPRKWLWGGLILSLSLGLGLILHKRPAR